MLGPREAAVNNNHKSKITCSHEFMSTGKVSNEHDNLACYSMLITKREIKQGRGIGSLGV